MKFRAHVRASDGTESTQDIEAANRFAVYTQVEQTGGSVLSLEETKGKGISLTNISFGAKKIKADALVTFTKNLSAMLAAGLTITRALSVIERQSTNKTLKEVVNDISQKISAGGTFHDALAAHAKIFPPLFIAMTKAGEESGNVSETLGIVARQMERSNQLIRKVKGAMIYPCIILFAIFVIGILMLIFVVPTLSATFAAFGSKLPLATQIILNLSTFMSHNAILVFLLLIAGTFGFLWFIRTKFGSNLLLWCALHMPVIGELVRETFSARAARTLSSLLASGVEMLTALGIAKEVVGENVFGKVVGQAEELVRKGEPLSKAFQENSKLYPIFVGDMISVGEETGKVSDMLGQVAQYYEVDVEDRTKDLSTIIEPLLMLFIGVFVGIFAVAMIGPIYSLSSKV